MLLFTQLGEMMDRLELYIKQRIAQGSYFTIALSQAWVLTRESRIIETSTPIKIMTK